MRRIPRFITNDERLDEYRSLPLDEAFARIIAVWRSLPALYRGPGPIGMKEIPLGSQLADWLVYEHPETEQALYDHLQDESVVLRAYCVHTLLRMGSRLLLKVPDTITECHDKVTRCYGCSIVPAPLSDLFTDELSSNSRMFAGEDANKPSGWWRHEAER